MPRRAAVVPLAPECHFSRRPTFADCDTIRMQLMENNAKIPRIDRVLEWRGNYQKEMMHAMCEVYKLVIQAIPQNGGKTFCASLMSCARILNGQRGVLAYPTLRQGARVAARRIDNWMRVLEEVYKTKRIMPDAAYEKEWANGGGIIVLSLDVGATSGVQGYTLEFGFLDEAHAIFQVDEVIGGILSRFDLAMQDRPGELKFGLICAMGVGGPKDSLIVHLRDRMHGIYKSYKYDDERIVKEYPPAKDTINEARLTWPPARYDQFYRLKDVAAGSRLLYPCLLTECPEVPMPPQYCVGVDSGKTSDYTVAVRVRIGASSVVEQTATWTADDFFTVPHGMTYKQQAQAIIAWAKPWAHRVVPGGRTCESNGIGGGLVEALQEEGWPDCNEFFITDKAHNKGLKSRLLDELRIADQNACLAVPEQVDGEPLIIDDSGMSAYKHFAGLTYSVDTEGQWEAEHSDWNSAVIAAISGI